MLVSINNRVPLLFNRIRCEVHYLISEVTRSVDDAPSFKISVGKTSSECEIDFALLAHILFKFCPFVIIWLCS